MKKWRKMWCLSLFLSCLISSCARSPTRDQADASNLCISARNVAVKDALELLNFPDHFVSPPSLLAGSENSAIYVQGLSAHDILSGNVDGSEVKSVPVGCVDMAGYEFVDRDEAFCFGQSNGIAVVRRATTSTCSNSFVCGATPSDQELANGYEELAQFLLDRPEYASSRDQIEKAGLHFTVAAVSSDVELLFLQLIAVQEEKTDKHSVISAKFAIVKSTYKERFVHSLRRRGVVTWPLKVVDERGRAEYCDGS